MPVFYNATDIPFPKIKRRETTNWIKKVVMSYRKRLGAITYVFCSDEKILSINKLFLKHDYYTDIITFDYSEKDEISGDLFISLETVKTNSEKFGTDLNEELYRVMIHGVLHLCGLKDKTAAEEKTMRRKEDEALQLRLEKTD